MKRIFFSFLICAGFLLTSCGGDEDENETLQVSPTSATFTKDGGTSSALNVTTNAKSWNATSGQSWLTVNKSDKSFTLTATANTGDARTATVSVTAGKANAVTVNVTQDAAGDGPSVPTLEISPNDKFPEMFENEVLEYEITTDATSWDAVSSHPWLTVNKAGNKLTMTANYGSIERAQAVVTLTAGSLSLDIEVTPMLSLPTVTLLDISDFSNDDGVESVNEEGATVIINKFIGVTDFVYKKINFEDGKRIFFRGIDEAKLAAAYNRDYFKYDAATGRTTFDGNSGTYDTYYSPKYNYVIVMQKDAVYPDCYWMAGNGYSAVASAWHEDFLLPADKDPVSYQGFNHFAANDYTLIFRGFFKPLGNDKFQITVWIGESNLFAGPDRESNDWYGFKANILANPAWDPFINEFSSVTGGSFCSNFPAAWDVATTDPNGDQGRWRITLTIVDPGPAIGSLVFEKAD